MEASGTTNNSNQNKKESTLKSSFFFFILIFVAAIIIDQVGKHLARNIFYNSNFAFSLPLPIWVIYGIYFFVLLGMIFFVAENFRKLNFISMAAWGIIFAGAVSNIAERIFTGRVRDFIYITFLKWTGIYNPADFFIILGIILLLMPRTRLKTHPNDLQNF